MGGGASYVVGFAFDGSLDNHFLKKWEVYPETEIQPEVSRMENRWDPKTGAALAPVAVIEQKRVIKKALKKTGYFFKEGTHPETLFQQFLAHPCSHCKACWDYDNSNESTWPKNRTDHSCGDPGPRSSGWEYMPSRFGYADAENDGLWDSGYKLKLNLEYDGQAQVWYSRIKDYPVVHIGDANHIDLSRISECEAELDDLRSKISAYGLEVPPATVSMVIYE
jgi:hypothetical protein